MNSVRSAVVAFLCAVFALVVGIWLGGHPENLPGALQDAFVAVRLGITLEASECRRRGNSICALAPLEAIRVATIGGIVG